MNIYQIRGNKKLINDLLKPIIISDEDGKIWDIIERSELVCDICNRLVAMSEDDIDDGGMDGYAVENEGIIDYVLCLECLVEMLSGMLKEQKGGKK